MKAWSLPAEQTSEYQPFINLKTADLSLETSHWQVQTDLKKIARGRGRQTKSLSRRRATSVAFGAKRTLTEPRSQNRIYDYTP